MKEFLRIIIIFILVCGIVFFSYNIYSFVNGNSDNIFNIAMYGSDVASDNVGTYVSKNVKLSDSGITGEEYDFNQVYNPYYAILTKKEKMLYKQIYANSISYKSTFVPVVELPVSRVLVIIESVINDHPELFWVGNSFSYRYNNKDICKQITLTFNGTQNDQETFYKVASEIVKNAKKYSTNYERELYVHDVLMEMVEYDENATNNQSAYSALVTRRTVCAGYARAFQYIMMQLGVPTYYVTGFSSGEDHAWNIVKLNDGFYNVDVTWDDELNNSHTLFNKTDEYFSDSHKRSELSSKLADCIVSTYDYKRISNKVEETYYYREDKING